MSNYFNQLGKVALGKFKEKEVESLLSKSKKNDLKRLKEVSQEFEAVFLQKIWEQMRKTVPKEGYLHNKEEDLYLSLFDLELSRLMAKSGGIGLSHLIFEQLKEQAKLQEQPNLNLEQKNSLKNIANLPVSSDQVEKEVEKIAEKIVSKASGPKGGVVTFPYNLLEKNELNREEERFIWPVKGKISSPFGWRIDPFTGSKAWHSGIDIAVPEKTPIKSCMSGKVIFAGDKAGYGKTVMIEHKNGLISLYAHNYKLLVQEGEFVRFGQKIALSGNSGRSTGPHLHFELRKKELALDPLAWRQKYLDNLTA